MPLYRCLECQREFEAAKPACAECGIDPATNPGDAGAVVPLVLIHFDPPTKRAGRGLGYAACDARVKVGAPKCGFSGHPKAVNCPRCKATEAFLAAGEDGSGLVDAVAERRVGPVSGTGAGAG